MFLTDLLSIFIQKIIYISFDINPQRHTTNQTVVFYCGKHTTIGAHRTGKLLRYALRLGKIRQS
jgi:hypothetical protein